MDLGSEPVAWAKRTAVGETDRQLLASLASNLLRRGWTDDDDLTLGAGEAFERRSGNCVSFALLLAGLSRAVGVDVVFVARDSGEGERRNGLRIDRAHLAVAIDQGDELVVFDLTGEHPSAGVGYRRVPDQEVLGVYHSNRGAALLQAGEMVEAIVALREATRSSPNLAAAWVNLGVAFGRVHAIRDAEACYRRAIAIAPESTSAWRNLALLLEQRAGSTP